MSNPPANETDLVYKGLSNDCSKGLSGYLGCVNEHVKNLRSVNSTYMPNINDFKNDICPNCKGNVTELESSCKDADIKANPRTVNFLVQCHQQDGYCIDQIYSDLGDSATLKPFSCDNSCHKYMARLLDVSGIANNNISDSDAPWKKADVKKCAEAESTSNGQFLFMKLQIVLGTLILSAI
eukprot:NODE_424_length_8864_cov_0.190188.p5 type:complete len:181 gc:universal NODE_424_length_8864_cov_0.190188:5094-4552(-)